MKSIELTEQEIQALTQLIDAAVRSLGLQCVPMVMQIMGKVQAAKGVAIESPDGG